MDEIKANLKQELDEAVKKATWKAASGGPLNILGQIDNPIHRTGAGKIAQEYGLKHGKAPTGNHETVVSVGPLGSGADFTNHIIKTRYSKSVKISFPPDEVKREPETPKIATVKRPRNPLIYLGTADVSEGFGSSFTSDFWIKKVRSKVWKITMLGEELDRHGDPKTVSVGEFTTEEAVSYVESLELKIPEELSMGL